MSDEERPRPRLLTQVVLLVLALAGWTAFGAAYLGMVNASKRAEQAETEADAIRQLADGVLDEKNRLIGLLRDQKQWLETRVAQLEKKLHEPR